MSAIHCNDVSVTQSFKVRQSMNPPPLSIVSQRHKKSSRLLVNIGNCFNVITVSSTLRGKTPHCFLCGPPPQEVAAYCVALCLSVRLSVRPVIVFVYFTVEPFYERTSKIEKLLFSLMGQRHVCTFRHAQRAAYRTAISAAQILVS